MLKESKGRKILSLSKVSVLIIAIILVLSVIGSVQAKELVFKLGQVLPAEHSWGICSSGFAEEVTKRTEGRVTIEVYHNAQLGNEKDMVEGLQLGTLQMGLIGGGSFQDLEPKMGIANLPYAWEDHFHAYRAFDGELGDKLLDLLAKKGIVGLSWWENGFRNITNNKRSINTPEDLKGLKLRVTPIKMRLDTFNALEALPVPMPFSELYSALQQGVVDGQENPLAIIYSNHFYEVQKYLSMTGHIWGTAILVISEKDWNKVSPEDKVIIEETAKKWADEQRKMIRDAEDDLKSKLAEKGMIINEVDKAPFIAKVQPVWVEYEETFGKDFIELIDKYRK
jgi:tripartite ATP-independent transporter DctP family solute receptor